MAHLKKILITPITHNGAECVITYRRAVYYYYYYY